MDLKYMNSGLLIGVFTMLGMGIGWLIGEIRIGLFIGLGMVISSFSQNKKNKNE